MTRYKLDRWGYEQFNDGTSQSLDTGEYKVKCTGFQFSPWRYYTLHVLSIIMFGVPYLILSWYPQYMAKFGYKRCQLKVADAVIIRNKKGLIKFCKVLKDPVVHFDYQLHRYIWNEEKHAFVLLLGVSGTLIELIETSDGISNELRNLRLNIYGRNLINLHLKSTFKILVNEILNPFYVFEILSVILWMFDEYYQYAICVIILSGISILTSLYQTRKQNRMVKNMVDTKNKHYVTVYDEVGGSDVIDSCDLVPGDLIEIPTEGCIMTCDALLLTGTCIVNECVLTGESTPVTKVPAMYVNEEYDPISLHARHTLYCGTHVIQTRYYHHDKVTALVVRTGSMTAKGQLVRSILFPKEFGFDFYRDAIRFIFIMFGVALFGTLYSIYLFLKRGAGLEIILLRSLDIVTIVVPPTLPAAMTVGTIYAQRRLKKKGIFCTSPPRINVAGKVKLVCFDKTGTLTEEGLNVWGVLMSNGKGLEDLVENPATLPIMTPFLHAMACCHSLTKINGLLCGDPLDLSMFESTGWELEEPGAEINRFDQLAPTVVKPKRWQFVNAINQMNGNGSSNLEHGDMKIPLEIGTLKQFPFSSNAQCMSVITRTLGSRQMTLYTKGAPEKILQMCNQESIPENMSITLSYYTSSGHRVIAIAYKQLPRKFTWLQAQKAERETVENNLTFLGLLLMQNTLKPQSAPVIKQLQHARIKCLMLTGDNLLTAVSVSRECGILAPTTPLSQVVVTTSPVCTVKLQPLNSSSNHTEVDTTSALAVDGATWSKLHDVFPSLLPLVATRGVIFARMSPQQKAHVVETLQSLDYIVAMVGDGANDCGALRTAHIGISLSTAEASIAAPFTSSVADVTCVPKLIMEGRCSLVTSFGIFNYMELYSMIQFSSVLILYIVGIEMGTNQFLYVDLFVTSSLAVVMGRARPSERIVPQRPISSLISLSNVVPLMLQILLCILMQFLSLYILRHEPWYVPVDRAEGDEEVVECWENTAIYLVSCYQYVILAVTYSKGKPHREPIYKNWLFMAIVTVLVGFNSMLLLFPWHQLTFFFELMPFLFNETLRFRFILLCLPIVQLVFSLIIEHTVARSFWFKWCRRKILRKKAFKNKYKTVETQILNSRFWDPLSF